MVLRRCWALSSCACRHQNLYLFSWCKLLLHPNLALQLPHFHVLWILQIPPGLMSVLLYAGMPSSRAQWAVRRFMPHRLVGKIKHCIHTLRCAIVPPAPLSCTLIIIFIWTGELFTLLKLSNLLFLAVIILMRKKWNVVRIAVFRDKSFWSIGLMQDCWTHGRKALFFTLSLCFILRFKIHDLSI